MCVLSDEDHFRLNKMGLLLYDSALNKVIDTIDISDDTYNDIKLLLGDPFKTRFDDHLNITTETFWV